MKKLSLLILSACLLTSPVVANDWDPTGWSPARSGSRHGSWGQKKYAEMDDAQRTLWEKVCQYLLHNPSVRKEDSWVDFLQERHEEDPEAVKHFINIVYAEYFGSWRSAKTVQLFRLRKIAQAIVKGKTTPQIAQLRASLPVPPSWKNKVAALAGLAAMGTCVYYLWQDYCTQETDGAKA